MLNRLPAVSARTWFGTALFAGTLLIMLAATLAILRRWRDRSVANTDQAQTIARNASLPFILQLLTRAIDFGFVMVLYRFVVKDAMGGYEFAGLLVVQYFGTIADWGLSVLTARDVARDHALAPIYFRTTLRLRLRFALLAIPVAALFVAAYNGLAALGLIATPLEINSGWLIGILVLTLLPAALSAAATALFQAIERMEIPAILNLLTNTLSALVRVGLLVLGFGVIGVAVGALIGALIGAGLFGLALRRQFSGLTWQGPVLPARPLLIDGWPLLLNSLLIGLFFRFDAIIINAFQGAAAVAEYTATYKFINLTQIIPPVVVNAIFPLLVRRASEDRAGMRRAYEGTLRLLLIIAVPLATGIAVLSTPLIAGLSGPEYLPGGATALAIIIWYLPWSFINGLTQYVVIALGRQRSITLAFGLTALFNIVLNVLLVPRYGYFASAAITIASELVLFWPLRQVVAREIGAPPLLALIWRPALAGIALGAAMWVAHQVHLALAVAVALPVYGLSLLALGTFTADDRRLVNRMLRRSEA